MVSFFLRDPTELRMDAVQVEKVLHNRRLSWLFASLALVGCADPTSGQQNQSPVVPVLLSAGAKAVAGSGGAGRIASGGAVAGSGISLGNGGNGLGSSAGRMPYGSAGSGSQRSYATSPPAAASSYHRHRYLIIDRDGSQRISSSSKRFGSLESRTALAPGAKDASSEAA